MTPSQQAKQWGCKSVREVSQLSGIPVRTLFNYASNNPLKFKVICLGSIVIRDNP